VSIGGVQFCDLFPPNAHRLHPFIYHRMYLGWDAKGINEEVSSTLQCADLCRTNNCESLAIPEASIIHTVLDATNNPGQNSFLEVSQSASSSNKCRASAKDIAQGILPSLKRIVDQDRAAQGDQSEGISPEITPTLRDKPDSHCDPLAVTFDPYGSDYFCKLCRKELSNSYFHCDGCEELLSRDFNICTSCYKEEKFKTFVRMHPKDSSRKSDINHLPAENNLSSKACNSRQGSCRVCRERKNCSLCKHCSCDCHERFTMHFRFMSPEQLTELLQDCSATSALADPAPSLDANQQGSQTQFAVTVHDVEEFHH